ncbi:membrane protein [Jannaschia pagri]|uniref:Membrane protein n=1 Tax=Jannaschia pagri TaxID=2829797 RepID=A0ABQ4NK59_9RHOB|nr:MULTISPECIES: AzlD domain-containing protein [unclassified Jannaschia]GIT90941.1 membrane protein [Jannaschia sp. AI_61]GIT94772.1 membrane protein [Jannaschia sp. AI_62]
MSDGAIWTTIVLLGIGTYAIRFSFLGLIGNRALPPAVLRHLRYTGVAVLPGLVTPLVVWPSATDGEIDPVRLTAAVVALAVGVWRKDTIQSVLAGGITFGLGAWLVA